MSRRFGSLIYYGDPGRPETLRAARLDQAEVFVLAMDDPAENVRIAKLVRRLYPDVKIVARARNCQHVYALWELEVTDVVRDDEAKMIQTSHEALAELEQIFEAGRIDAEAKSAAAEG